MDVYVTGINPEVTAADVQRLFRLFGDVRSIKMIMEAGKATIKGAVVDMASDQAGDTAIMGLNGKTLKSSVVHVGRSPRRSVGVDHG